MISYSDGTMNDEDIIKYVNNISKKNTILQIELQERIIQEFPSFFEYLSYMNNFITGFAGPWIDYNEHRNWIERRGVY